MMKKVRNLCAGVCLAALWLSPTVKADSYIDCTETSCTLGGYYSYTCEWGSTYGEFGFGRLCETAENELAYSCYFHGQYTGGSLSENFCQEGYCPGCGMGAGGGPDDAASYGSVTCSWQDIECT